MSMQFDFTYREAIGRVEKNIPELRRIYPEDWQSEIIGFLEKWVRGSGLFEINTSGTTGPPKSIYFTRNELLSSAFITIKTFGIKPGDTLLMSLPLKFVAGKLMLVRAMAGHTKLLIFKPESNPLKTLNLKVDFAAFTPHQLKNILKENPEKLHLIRQVIIGGSPVNKELQEELQQLDTVFYETYGMSETLTHIAIRPLNGPGKSDYFSVLEGIEIDLNQSGCLTIKAGHLSNSPIETTDLVELKSPGRFKWIGRADDVINSGGVKLFPAIIEKKLSVLMDAEFVIKKQPDSELGEVVVLFVEGKPFDKEKMELLKREWIALLNKYEIPKKTVFIHRFPRNKNGKIIKSEMGE